MLQNSNYLVALNNYLPKSYQNSLTGWQFVTANYKPGGSIYAVPYGAGSTRFYDSTGRSVGTSTTTGGTTTFYDSRGHVIGRSTDRRR